MLGLAEKYGEGVMPVGCVRVGYVDGTLVLDPDVQALDQSGLDLLYAGNKPTTPLPHTFTFRAIATEIRCAHAYLIFGHRRPLVE